MDISRRICIPYILTSFDLNDSNLSSTPASQTLDSIYCVSSDNIMETLHPYVLSTKAQRHSFDTPIYSDVQRSSQVERKL